MENMTALVSAFARAYHYRNSSVHVFADPLAERMLTEEEYDGISRHMAQGISWFAPEFRGSPEAALRFIVDHQLAPSVLARSAFCERAIGSAMKAGVGQIVVYGCGYDTFSLRAGDARLRVFELDRPEIIGDRRRRIARSHLTAACRAELIGCDLALPGWESALTGAGYDPSKPSFSSLLGISYYLSKEDFSRLIETVSSICCEGSSVCFDYPLSEGGAESRRNRDLAAAAGERMKAEYRREELEPLLSAAGFRLCEHVNAAEATAAFFREYNRGNPDRVMAAPEGVGYCLAVKGQRDGRDQSAEGA
ncbi:MAG: class I SAM-dependent methyltransferase [Clostridia bacterium]|nr:class I SAM-dependent methyltransferase [Clostridia bacterium]